MTRHYYVLYHYTKDFIMQCNEPWPVVMTHTLFTIACLRCSVFHCGVHEIKIISMGPLHHNLVGCSRCTIWACTDMNSSMNNGELYMDQNINFIGKLIMQNQKWHINIIHMSLYKCNMFQMFLYMWNISIHIRLPFSFQW